MSVPALPTTPAMREVLEAAKAFIAECPMDDNDDPYQSEFCGSPEFKALVKAVNSQLCEDGVCCSAKWQPIETAPISNGSKNFIAHIPGHGRCVCYRLPSGQVYNASKGKRVYRASHWHPDLRAPTAKTGGE